MTHSFHKRVLVSALAACLLQAGSASALGLMQAYEAALNNDPTYRAAVYENKAGQQNKILARSTLLPNISASYSRNKNSVDITSPDALGQRSTIHRNYASSAGSIQLRQPLVNFESFARYRQGLAQSEFSDAQFSVRSQDLIQRLFGAYIEAKYAEDRLALAVVQRDVLAEQRRMNDRMFEEGEGTKTDMLETQAKYDLSEAQLIEAQDNVTDTRNALTAIVGQEITTLDPLRDDFHIKAMELDDFEKWKSIALEKNPEILAQRYAVEAAYQDIKRNRAGHAPRLDLIASLSDSSSETTYTFNQDIKNTSVGLQFSLPLYAGGYATAMTSQAVANHEKAKADLDKTISRVSIDLQKNFNAAKSSALRVGALVNAVSSARLLVEATQKSIRGGLRTNLDVLNAQQQLFTVKRDLAQARYSYLISYLRLRQAAGVVGVEDLQYMASFFVKNTQ